MVPVTFHATTLLLTTCVLEKIVRLKWSRKLPPDGLMTPYFCSTKLLAHSLRRFLPKPLKGREIPVYDYLK